MQKSYVLAVLAGAFLFVACGSSKKTVASKTVNPYGKVVEAEPCIELYEQSPCNRAYGNGQHFKEATARNIAELQARAMFARKIESAILSATEDMGISMEKYAADDQSGQSVADQSGEANDLAMGMEYAGDENTLVDQIERSVQDKISQDDRTKIEQRHNEFRRRILERLTE